MTLPKDMPVHPEDRKNVKGCPQSVPMALLSEQQAQSNHGQTLQRLAERGGLSIREMLAVMHRKPYDFFGRVSDEFALILLNGVLQIHTLQQENERLRKALEKIIEMNRQHASDQYGNPDVAERSSCVRVARAALT